MARNTTSHQLDKKVYVFSSEPMIIASKPPEFKRRSSPARGYKNLGVFVPIWLVLPRCEATNLGVFDLCHFALLKRGCANSDAFGAC